MPPSLSDDRSSGAENVPSSPATAVPVTRLPAASAADRATVEPASVLPVTVLLGLFCVIDVGFVQQAEEALATLGLPPSPELVALRRRLREQCVG